MKLNTTTILTAMLAFMACNRPAEVVGGPCTYKTTYYPAKVIAIAAIDSNSVNLLFEVKMGENLDSLSFFDINNHYLTPQEVSAAAVKEGTVFSLAFDQIETGTCTPEIKRLELKPYQAGAH